MAPESDFKPGANAAPGIGSRSSTQNRNGQYRRAQIETASPTRLVVLLYDGAIRFCALAIDAMQKRDLQTQHTNLIKAQRIISELMSSLNRQDGGEVAENLFRIYVHLLEQLVLANLYDQIDTVHKVKGMLESLRETWTEVDRLATLGEGGLTDRASMEPVNPAKGPLPNTAPPAPARKVLSAGAQPLPQQNRLSRLGDRSA